MLVRDAFFRVLPLVALTALLICAQPASAQRQQVTTGTPFSSGNHSFFERNGVNWQVQGNGFFFRMGGFNNAVPQFGGFQPGAGLEGGFGFAGPGGLLGRANFEFSQGARASLVSQTPSVTMMNGQTAIFSDTSQSPFVVSFRPPMLPPPREGLLWKQQLDGEVPKQLPDRNTAAPDADPDGQAVSPLQRQLNSEHSDATASVAEIKQRRKNARDAAESQRQTELAELLRQAREALDDGKPGLARVFLRSAAPLAGESDRAAIETLQREAGQ